MQDSLNIIADLARKIAGIDMPVCWRKGIPELECLCRAQLAEVEKLRALSLTEDRQRRITSCLECSPPCGRCL